jgi:hypothetical protein
MVKERPVAVKDYLLAAFFETDSENIPKAGTGIAW